MTGVLIKRGNLEIDLHTRRPLCEHKDRNLGDASASQETPKIASKPREARQEALTGPSVTALRRNQPCQHLDLGLLASRTVRK